MDGSAFEVKVLRDDSEVASNDSPIAGYWGYASITGTYSGQKIYSGYGLVEVLPSTGL